MIIFDVNALIGNWAFRKLHKASLNDLNAVNSANNIECSFVSSIDSILYNDPLEGDSELHDRILNSNYRHILTVNPNLPMFENDINYAIRSFNIVGIKVFPSFYNCKLAPLTNIIRKTKIPLFISARLNSEREDYIFTPPPPDLDDIAGFISANPDIKVVLLTFNSDELAKLPIANNPNVFFDVSWIRYSPIEKLVSDFGAEHMLYGSLHPFLCLESSLLTLLKADISDTKLKLICYQNAERLIGN